MKKREDKAMSSDDVQTRGLGASRDASAVEYVCVQDCVVPGAGAFRHGQNVTDPAMIAKISSSPCFKRTEEVV